MGMGNGMVMYSAGYVAVENVSPTCINSYAMSVGRYTKFKQNQN